MLNFLKKGFSIPLLRKYETYENVEIDNDKKINMIN